MLGRRAKWWRLMQSPRYFGWYFNNSLCLACFCFNYILFHCGLLQLFWGHPARSIESLSTATNYHWNRVKFSPKSLRLRGWRAQSTEFANWFLKRRGLMGTQYRDETENNYKTLRELITKKLQHCWFAKCPHSKCLQLALSFNALLEKKAQLYCALSVMSVISWAYASL